MGDVCAPTRTVGQNVQISFHKPSFFSPFLSTSAKLGPGETQYVQGWAYRTARSPFYFAAGSRIFIARRAERRVSFLSRVPHFYDGARACLPPYDAETHAPRFSLFIALSVCPRPPVSVTTRVSLFKR